MSNLTRYMQSTDVALSGDDFVNALQGGIKDKARAGGDFEFLNYSGKSGIYQYGRDKEDLDVGNRFLIVPPEATSGFACWKGRKIIDRFETKTANPNLTKVLNEAYDSLEDHGPYNAKSGDGWKEEQTFYMFDLISGKQVKFGTTSASGNNVFTDMLAKVLDQAILKEGWFPIIELSGEEFTAQEQVNWKPLMEVIQWITPEAVTAWVNDELSYVDLLNGKAPKKKRVKAKKKK